MTITIDPQDWRKVVAEVVGTFFFFFIGIGSALVLVGTSPSAFNTLDIALAHGFALALAISALGHISGGHFNPAVTISLAVTRKIGPVLALFYIIGQIVGGLIASYTLWAVLPSAIVNPAHVGAPS